MARKVLRLAGFYVRSRNGFRTGPHSRQMAQCLAESGASKGEPIAVFYSDGKVAPTEIFVAVPALCLDLRIDDDPNAPTDKRI